jgi:hypothetical protein
MLAAAIATCAAGSSPAHAESDVVVIGGATEHAQLVAVRGAIENTLRKAGWTWPARPPSQKEADSLLKCDDSRSPWTCIPATISGLHARDIQRVFVVSVESRTAPAPMIVLTGKVIVTASPPAFVVRQRFCEQCSTGELIRASEDLTQQLFGELAARAAVTALEVTSEPAGADITLDGARAGATNTRLVTTPGRHVIALAKPGFVSETRTVGAAQDRATAVEVALHAASPVAPPPPVAAPPVATADTSRSSRAIPAVAIASGAMLVAFGSYALYLGQLGSREDRFRYTHATAVGAGSIVLGLGAAGAGLYLWRRPDGSGLFGAAGHGGSFLVWNGRF